MGPRAIIIKDQFLQYTISLVFSKFSQNCDDGNLENFENTILLKLICKIVHKGTLLREFSATTNYNQHVHIR